MTPRRKREPPLPPAGLTAVSPSLWLPIWRHVRVDPSAEVKPWLDGDTAKVTASVKNVGIWAYTFADYSDGTRIHPGLEKLANIAGVTTRTAGAALAAMCRLGFLWQYVDGSKSGRPMSGKSSPASEYRLTIPDDYLSGRVPLLTARYGLPDEDDQLNSDQVISLHQISDQLISDPRSPELRAEITRTQFAPPKQDLDTHLDITGVSVAATSVEGNPATPNRTNDHDFEAHRQRQMEALAAWIRDQEQESA